MFDGAADGNGEDDDDNDKDGDSDGDGEVRETVTCKVFMTDSRLRSTLFCGIGNS